MDKKKLQVVKTVEKLQGTPYKYTKEDIRSMIEGSTLAVERAIITVYNRQTEREKRVEQAKYLNNIGFSAFHARRGTYYAKWIISGKHLNNGHVEKGRELILHYVEQLTKIVNKEI